MSEIFTYGNFAIIERPDGTFLVAHKDDNIHLNHWHVASDGTVVAIRSDGIQRYNRRQLREQIRDVLGIDLSPKWIVDQARQKREEVYRKMSGEVRDAVSATVGGVLHPREVWENLLKVQTAMREVYDLTSVQRDELRRRLQEGFENEKRKKEEQRREWEARRKKQDQERREYEQACASNKNRLGSEVVRACDFSQSVDDFRDASDVLKSAQQSLREARPMKREDKDNLFELLNRAFDDLKRRRDEYFRRKAEEQARKKEEWKQRQAERERREREKEKKHREWRDRMLENISRLKDAIERVQDSVYRDNRQIMDMSKRLADVRPGRRADDIRWSMQQKIDSASSRRTDKERKLEQMRRDLRDMQDKLDRG